MDKLLFLLLFNGLHGYPSHGMPTGNSKEQSINIELGFHTDEHKLRVETGHIFIKLIREDEIEATTWANNTPGQWPMVWYVAAFGGLIVFFLTVSCCEWCCRRSARARFARSNSPSPSTPVTPPPSYDQFGPPPYDSLKCDSNGEKNEYDIYFVHVHASGAIVSTPNQASDDPPSYPLENNDQQQPPSLNLSVQMFQRTLSN